MTPEEFMKRLEGLVENSIEDLKPVMEEAALTGKALLARRVQNTGFGRNYTSRSYVNLRKRRGFEIRFVNLTFTGGMFRGWKVPDSIRRGFVVTGRVGGVDQATQNKLKWNKSRYPNFDKSSDEERELLKNSLIQPRLKAIFQNNLTGR